MENPVMTLKPSIINALLPTYMKWFFYCLLVAFGFFIVYIILKAANVVPYSFGFAVLFLLLMASGIALIPLAIRILSLANTNYYFYDTHVVSEFKFFKIKRYSVPYHQIAQVTMDMSFWDRFCKAGDIVLHTAEQKAPNLVLYYVKNPHELEHRLYSLVHKHKTSEK